MSRTRARSRAAWGRSRPQPPPRSSRGRDRAPTIPPSVLLPVTITRRRHCRTRTTTMARRACWWGWARCSAPQEARAPWPGRGPCRGLCPPQTSLLWLPEQSHPFRRRYPPRQLHLHLRAIFPDIPSGTHCQLSHRPHSTLILTGTSSELAWILRGVATPPARRRFCSSRTPTATRTAPGSKRTAPVLGCAQKGPLSVEWN